MLVQATRMLDCLIGLYMNESKGRANAGNDDTRVTRFPFTMLQQSLVRLSELQIVSRKPCAAQYIGAKSRDTKWNLSEYDCQAGYPTFCVCK